MLNNQTGLKRLIFANAAAGELPQINEYTVTGNPAEFSTNLIRPLQAFEVPLLPVQSGSGTPSPSNVRTISGWPGITVTSNGQTVLVAWESAVGVVYGGTVDLVTGVMTVTHYYIEVTKSNLPSLKKYAVESGAFLAQFERVSNDIPKWVGASAISNRFSQSISSGPGRLNANMSGTSIYFFIPLSELSSETVNAVWDWFEAHPTQLVYELDSPQTIQLTHVEIKTIIGQNSIGTNTNGTNTIKYLKRG